VAVAVGGRVPWDLGPGVHRRFCLIGVWRPLKRSALKVHWELEGRRTACGPHLLRRRIAPR
jgi:hypothetical protein